MRVIPLLLALCLVGCKLPTPPITEAPTPSLRLAVLHDAASPVPATPTRPPVVEPAQVPDAAPVEPLLPEIPMPEPQAPAPVVADAVPVVPIAKDAPLVALPKALLSDAGRELIYEFEVGGGKAYYEKYLAFPTMPGGASGVTIGIGCDLRFNSKAVIRSDWHMLPPKDLERLIACQGLSGDAARAAAKSCRDIRVPWAAALEVFEKVTVTKFTQLCRVTYRGYDDLGDHPRDATLSLTFNRGNSMIGDSRRHMREYRDLIPKKDYKGMANNLKASVIIWRGKDIEKGMTRRRYAEAALAGLP